MQCVSQQLPHPLWLYVSRHHHNITLYSGLKHLLVTYQCEVDKGKLTAVASFEKLTSQA